GKQLSWKNTGADVTLEIPAFDPNTMSISDAYVIRLTPSPDFVAQPAITMNYEQYKTDPVVSIASETPCALMYYTTDGSRPNQQSTPYTQPCKVKKSVHIKAVAYKKDWVSSRIDSADAEVFQWHKAVKISAPVSGISYRYYESDSLSL